jgi:hypothetical protein
MRSLLLVAAIASLLSQLAVADDTLMVLNNSGYPAAVAARYSGTSAWSKPVRFVPEKPIVITVKSPGKLDLRFYDYMPDGTVEEYGVNRLDVRRLANVGPGNWIWPPASVDQFGIFHSFHNGRWQHWACNYRGVFSATLKASPGNVTMQFERAAVSPSAAPGPGPEPGREGGAGSIDPREPIGP